MIDMATFNIAQALDRALHTPSMKLRYLSLPSTQVVRKKTIVPRAYNKALDSYESQKDKSVRVKRELIDAGMTLYGLLKSETRVLPKLLHPNEHVEAVIYGQHQSNSAMLVATDERIIYVDKKPIALFLDEVSYEVVSGIQFDIHLFFTSVVLHTPVKNYNFKFVNLRCGENFARHIEKHRLEREPKEAEPVVEVLPRKSEWQKTIDDHRLNDMAGYYLLPSDEEERKRIQPVQT